MQVEGQGSWVLGSSNRIRGNKDGGEEGKRCFGLADSERS